MMTCCFCGTTFDKEHAGAACQSCPMSKACALVRCPHCGYEMSPEPQWIGALKKWFLRMLKKEKST